MLMWFSCTEHPAILRRNAKRRAGGYTLLELLMGLLVAMVMTGIAVPMVRSAVNAYRIRSAVSAVTGAIQSTRYQAISSGYPFQIILNKANATYTIQRFDNATSTYVNTQGPVPLSGSGTPVILDQDVTLQFRPSGLVQATVGTTALSLTFDQKTEQILVSSYGNIHVTP